MRYCEYCGTQLDDDALFCEKCGAKLSPLDLPSEEPPINEINTPQVSMAWVKSADMVFRSVVALTVTGLLTIVVDFLALGDHFEHVYSTKNIFGLSSTADAPSEVFPILQWILRTLVLISYCYYMVGLSKFAKAQPTEYENRSMKGVHSSVVIQFICFSIFSASILLPGKDVGIIPILAILMAIFLIICYLSKRNCYKKLRESQNLSKPIRKCAEQLRFAAVCNINLIVLPIITLLIIAFIIYGTMGSVRDFSVVIAVIINIITNLKGITNHHGGATGQAEGALTLCLAIIAVAAILALIWGICALVYPLRAWNKMRKMEHNPEDIPIPAEAAEGTPAPEGDKPAPAQEAAAAPISTAVSEPQTTPEPASTPEPSLAPESPRISEAPDVPLASEAPKSAAPIESPKKSESISWFQKNKRWALPAGILGVVALLGVGAWLLFGGSENKPLGVEPPKWEKFVMVTSDKVTVHKEANDDSPTLIVQTENAVEFYELDVQYRWSDESERRGYTSEEFHPSTESVMPVLEETDNWYKVRVDYWYSHSVGYVPKDKCKAVEPAPITKEVLEHINKEMGYRRDYLIESGKYKNLCLTTEIYEEEGVYERHLYMGELADGCLLFPNYDPILIENTGTPDISISRINTNDVKKLLVFYGSNHEYNFGNMRAGILDPAKFIPEQVNEIYEFLKTEMPPTATAKYYFPEVSKDCFFTFDYTPGREQDDASNVTATPAGEDAHISGYTVDYSDDDAILMAEISTGGYEKTGVSYPGMQGSMYGLTIVNVGDYDKDGDMEAVVQEVSGGSSGEEPPYIVYYDNSQRAYQKTIPFGKWQDVTVEERNGKTVLIQRYGIHEDWYVFENKVLKQTENKNIDVGRTLVEWTRSGMFGDEADSKYELYDMDGDGIDEVIMLTHDHSHPYDWGNCISLDMIKWTSGYVYYCYQNYVPPYESFAVLESMTNGMHDILAGSTHLYRWNGSNYQEWVWNGTELVER